MFASYCVVDKTMYFSFTHVSNLLVYVMGLKGIEDMSEINQGYFLKHGDSRYVLFGSKNIMKNIEILKSVLGEEAQFEHKIIDQPDESLDIESYVNVFISPSNNRQEIKVANL